MKSIFVVCDKEGNPFFADSKGKDQYLRVWAFKNKDEAELGKNTTMKVVEYRPAKGK